MKRSAGTKECGYQRGHKAVLDGTPYLLICLLQLKTLRFCETVAKYIDYLHSGNLGGHKSHV